MMNGIMADNNFWTDTFPYLLIAFVLITIVLELVIFHRFFRKEPKRKVLGAVLVANLASYLAGVVLVGLA